MCIALLLLLLSGTSACAEPSTWIHVDTHHRTLSVMQGTEVKAVFRGIALGRGGVAPFRRAGDGKTPIGVFYVSWINPDSQYHLFFGLDYPAVMHAEEGYRAHVIDQRTYRAIVDARRRGELPPQDTALGGHIGIHGVGRYDPDDARLFDWTLGCVALTDQQVDELAQWMSLGTMVVIQ
ncbi:MAG: L,D-transpeptidase family protein [Chromatiales bacterium]|nr:L,D-transpeptidase family protein [Chromatiales bacterium]